MSEEKETHDTNYYVDQYVKNLEEISLLGIKLPNMILNMFGNLIDMLENITKR